MKDNIKRNINNIFEKKIEWEGLTHTIDEDGNVTTDPTEVKNEANKFYQNRMTDPINETIETNIEIYMEEVNHPIILKNPSCWEIFLAYYNKRIEKSNPLPSKQQSVRPLRNPL